MEQIEDEEEGEVILTWNDYANAISNVLTTRQIEVLQYLYYSPNKSATAKQLSLKINPKNPAPIVANNQIGFIGKAIADFLDVIPVNTYVDDKGEMQSDMSGWFNVISSEGYSKITGWTMDIELQKALEYLELVSLDGDAKSIIQQLPTEEFLFDSKKFFQEGKVVEVIVNRFERNQTARDECIKHYGDKCFVCGFDFNSTYGEIAEGFIHVHHLKPLSEIGEEYNVDPINDLIPVCANCHSVIHLTRPAMTIDEIKKLVKLNP